MTLLNIILCSLFGVVQCVFIQFKVKKVHYLPHNVHYCCSSMPAFLKRVDFYKAHCSEKRGVL